MAHLTVKSMGNFRFRSAETLTVFYFYNDFNFTWTKL